MKLFASEFEISNWSAKPYGEIPYIIPKFIILAFLLRSLVKDFLSNDSKLLEATKRYKEKCLEYEDSNYIKKIENFIDEETKKQTRITLKIPYWYEFIFFKATCNLFVTIINKDFWIWIC